MNQKYLKSLPTLVIGLGLYFVWLFLLRSFSPDQFQHFLWPNSYLPVMILFWLANFFVGAFAFLSSRRGVEWAVIVSMWLYLRLLQVNNWWLVVLFLALLVLFLELGLKFLKRDSQ